MQTKILIFVILGISLIALVGGLFQSPRCRRLSVFALSVLCFLAAAVLLISWLAPFPVD